MDYWKLLKLLKQYWKETFNDKTLLRIDYEENTDCFSWIYQPAPWMELAQWQILETPVVFSKKFKFIERLVINDKIDFQKVMERNKNWYDITRVNPDDNFIDNAIEYDDEFDLFIIMLLAISDNPIQDLIDLLR